MRIRIGAAPTTASKAKARALATTAKTQAGGNYFTQEEKDVAFISSGSRLLDLALGGGWAQGRIANIVGDKSTGKTLLCIEACANFILKFPKGKIYYREAEAAFDKSYAAALGMPVEKIDFGNPLETVEDLFEDITAVLKRIKGPALYICDSLDALSDRGELGRDMDQGSYGAEKAKRLSQMFRRLVRKMENKELTLIIVSQVRDKIGVTFGRKTTRSGGKALDFYASQVVYLANLGTEYQKVRTTNRATGVNVRAKMDKNKVGLPFRECDITITFGFGVDDLRSCVAWLKQVKALGDADISKSIDPKAYAAECMNDMDDKEYAAELKAVRKAVTARWFAMEKSIVPRRKKYA